MRNLAVFVGLSVAASAVAPLAAAAKNVMLMNRIGPSKSELYVANADGSGEHKLLSSSGFDYHASYSYDGQWIVFTSERSGYGQADLYRVHADGTGLERLTDDPALDDQGVLSPDGKQVAFVSTREAYRANIWILDLKTKQLRNLTGRPDIQGNPMKPDAFLRPAWSPDGNWIAFTSDRNTEWKGHGNGSGWEHVQELSVYIVHPDARGCGESPEQEFVQAPLSGRPMASRLSYTRCRWRAPGMLACSGCPQEQRRKSCQSTWQPGRAPRRHRAPA